MNKLNGPEYMSVETAKGQTTHARPASRYQPERKRYRIGFCGPTNYRNIRLI